MGQRSDLLKNISAIIDRKLWQITWEKRKPTYSFSAWKKTCFTKVSKQNKQKTHTKPARQTKIPNKKIKQKISILKLITGISTAQKKNN